MEKKQRTGFPTKSILQIVAVLTLIFCVLGIALQCSAIGYLFRGQVEITSLDSGTKQLLNGASMSGAAWITLPEALYLEASGGISGQTRAGVIAMGLNRYLPPLAAMVLIILVLYNIVRNRVFTGRNVRFLKIAGFLCVGAGILTPLINARLIPALVKATSDNVLSVGLNVVPGIQQIFTGITLLLAAYLFQYARTAISQKQGV